MVCGIGSAISKYPCIWCKCRTDEKFDVEQNWSITDVNKGARTVQEIEQLSSGRGSLDLKFSCKQPPFFPSIPLPKVVIDTLHLFLRISDNLQNLLILELRRQDAIEKKVTFNAFDRGVYRHMAGYEQFVNKCNIQFSWFVDKETKKLKWRDFTGPEKLILFSKIEIPSLLSNFSKKFELQELWDDFIKIYDILRMKDFVAVDIPQSKITLHNWMKLFLSIYQTKHVTPYMHALVQHVPEFINLHDSLVAFNRQGLEKLNQFQTKDFLSFNKPQRNRCNVYASSKEKQN